MLVRQVITDSLLSSLGTAGVFRMRGLSLLFNVSEHSDVFKMAGVVVVVVQRQ